VTRFLDSIVDDIGDVMGSAVRPRSVSVCGTSRAVPSASSIAITSQVSGAHQLGQAPGLSDCRTDMSV
jgi:hypothetical protein